MQRRIELVEWMDTCSFDGGRDLRDIDSWTPQKCYTVGWVLRETETFVVLAASHQDEEEDTTVDAVGDVIAIPKGMISDRRVLYGG